MRVQRRLKKALGFALVLREERPAVQDDRTCPASFTALRPRLEDIEPGTGCLPFASADCSFDPIEPTPEDDGRGGDLSTAPERRLWPTESQLEQSQRPMRELGDDPETASGGELTTLGRQRPALVFGSSQGRDECEQDELLRNDVVLAGLPRQLDPLLRMGRR
jgi:hypothetical protein